MNEAAALRRLNSKVVLKSPFSMSVAVPPAQVHEWHAAVTGGKIVTPREIILVRLCVPA
jgi:hypothetical protein